MNQQQKQSKQQLQLLSTLSCLISKDYSKPQVPQQQHPLGPKQTFQYPISQYQHQQQQAANKHMRQYSETSSFLDEQQMTTSIMQESSINQQHLIPNKPNTDAFHIINKHKNTLALSNQATLSNEHKTTQQKSTKAPYAYQQQHQQFCDKEVVDKCKENMKKRRMLFQRDQAEKKEISDTSVNNTVIDGESCLHSNSHSREHSRGPKRESQFSSSSIVSDINSSWLNDPEWHRYSAKLAKMAKWQSKCEQHLGFDPISYFGGSTTCESDNLLNVKKDPRFSCTFIVYIIVEMFKGDALEEQELTNSQYTQLLEFIRSTFSGEESISEEEIIRLIKSHQEYKSKQKSQGSQEEIKQQIEVLECQDQEEEIQVIGGESYEIYNPFNDSEIEVELNAQDNLYSSKETFAQELHNHDTVKQLHQSNNSQTFVQTNNHDSERILNIFSNDPQIYTSSDQTNKYIATTNQPLTERANRDDLYAGQINLFSLTKSNSSKSISLKAQHQNNSRSNSKDRPQQPSTLKKKKIYQSTSNLIQKIPLYKMRNQNQLTQLLSHQSIKSDIYNKYVPLSEKSTTSHTNVGSVSNIKMSMNFGSHSKKNGTVVGSSQNSIVQFLTTSQKKNDVGSIGNSSQKPRSKIVNSNSKSKVGKQSNCDEALTKINKFYQNADQDCRSTSTNKVRSKTPMTCPLNLKLSTSVANLKQQYLNTKTTSTAQTQGSSNLFQSMHHSNQSVLSARSNTAQQIMSQKNTASQMFNTSGSQSHRIFRNQPQSQVQQSNQYSNLQSHISTCNNPQIMNMTQNTYKSTKSKPRGSQSNLQLRKTHKSKENHPKRSDIMIYSDENQFNHNPCEISFSDNKDRALQDQSSYYNQQYNIPKPSSKPLPKTTQKVCQQQQDYAANVHSEWNRSSRGHGQATQKELQFIMDQGIFNLDYCESQFNMMPSPHFSTNDRSDKFLSQ